MRLLRPAWWAASLALLLTAGGAAAQGTFQNLGFESATLVQVPGQPPFYYFAQAFPGWTGYVGGSQPGLTVYNTLAMDTAGFNIIDGGFSNPSGLPGGLIQGNYTAVLMSGIAQLMQPADTTLAQAALVPAGTESLWFRAYLATTRPADSFGVTLGGQTLSLIPVQAGSNYTLYAADVHAWAGQTAELDFTAFAERPHHNDTYLYLDSIQFSTLPAPEPGMLGLSSLGALVLGWHTLRRRR